MLSTPHGDVVRLAFRMSSPKLLARAAAVAAVASALQAVVDVDQIRWCPSLPFGSFMLELVLPVWTVLLGSWLFVVSRYEALQTSERVRRFSRIMAIVQAFRMMAIVISMLRMNAERNPAGAHLSHPLLDVFTECVLLAFFIAVSGRRPNPAFIRYSSLTFAALSLFAVWPYLAFIAPRIVSWPFDSWYAMRATVWSNLAVPAVQMIYAIALPLFFVAAWFSRPSDQSRA